MSSVLFGGSLITGSVALVSPLAYIYANRHDAQYVQANTGAEWPNVRVYTVLGLVTLLNFRTFSYLLSPYYLYKRRKVLAEK